MSKIKSIDDLPDFRAEDAPVPEMSQLEAGIQGGAQGATLGFADELAGGIATAGAMATGQSPDGKYEQYRDLIRRQYAQAEKEHPKTTMGAEMVGGLAGPGLEVALAEKLGMAGAKAVMKKLLSDPTKYGAIYGAGKSESEDVTGVTLDAAKGAITAKAASLVGPKMGAVIGGGMGYAASKDNEDMAYKIPAGVLLGAGIGHANKASGTDLGSKIKGLGKDVKSVKKLTDLAEDTRNLGSDASLAKATNEDVTEAALDVARQLADRDSKTSKQFGTAIDEASKTGKVTSVLEGIVEQEAKLKAIKNPSEAESKDLVLVTNFLTKLREGTKQKVTKYEPDLNRVGPSEKEQVLQNFENRAKELTAQGKEVGPLVDEEGLVSMAVSDPNKKNSEQAVLESILKKQAELKARYGNNIKLDDVKNMSAEELQSQFPVQQQTGTILADQPREINISKAYSEDPVAPKIMAKAVSEEAPFTPVRQVSREEMVPPAVDPSKYSARDIKDHELETRALIDKLSSPREQSHSEVKNLLEDYRRNLNKQLYTLAPETEQLGSSIAAERTFKEDVLGFNKNDGTVTDQAAKVAQYIRDKSKEGPSAENALSGESLARTKIASNPSGKATMEEIDKLLASPTEKYKVASYRSDYIAAPAVGKTKAALSAAGGITRLASAAGTQYRKTVDAVKNLTPEVVQNLVNTGVVSDKSVAAKLSAAALENDPIKKNAMIFSLSQSPSGSAALREIRMPASSEDELPDFERENE